MVEDLVVAHAVAATALLEQVGRVGHAFHAAGHHHVTATGHELVVREDGGFHAGAAHLGQRHRAGAARQATLEAGLACRRLALACHQAVAEQHFVYLLRGHAGARHGGLDGSAAQVVRSEVREVALERAHGGARRADDDDGVLVGCRHGKSPGLKWGKR